MGSPVAKSPSVSARGGSNFAIGSKLAKQLGQEFDWHAAYEKLLGSHTHRVNEQLWSIFANKSEEAMDWMCEKAVADGLTPLLQHPNTLGECYCNENIISGHHAMQTLLQPGKKVYAIWDSGYAEKMPNTEPYVGAPRPDAK